MHTSPHPLAGKTVALTSGGTLRVEDWQDRVFGASWTVLDGNPACLDYAVRGVQAGLPIDDKVVYGRHSGGTSSLVHTSELASDGDS